MLALRRLSSMARSRPTALFLSYGVPALVLVAYLPLSVLAQRNYKDEDRPDC